jgi:citrate synthase
LIEIALILCADDELNASSFAARVVASAGATPYAVVIAGLSALSGTRHGGMTERTSALLRELETVDSARALITDRLRRGEIIPGFGHKLYPDGDPRAVVLLDALGQVASDNSRFRQAVELLHLMAERGEYPTLDVALAVLERTLALPDSKSLTIFALGRAVGWIGHAIEQYEDGRLLRPRAKYVGDDPR